MGVQKGICSALPTNRPSKPQIQDVLCLRDQHRSIVGLAYQKRSKYQKQSHKSRVHQFSFRPVLLAQTYPQRQHPPTKISWDGEVPSHDASRPGSSKEPPWIVPPRSGTLGARRKRRPGTAGTSSDTPFAQALRRLPEGSADLCVEAERCLQCTLSCMTCLVLRPTSSLVIPQAFL